MNVNTHLRRKKILAGVIIAILLICMAFPVFAAEAEVTLPVSQRITVAGEDEESSVTDEVTVTYKLKAENGGPLPEQAENGEHVFSLNGTDAGINLAMQYDQTGEYRYLLEMDSVTGVNGRDYSTEMSSVEIVVTVSDQNGSGHVQAIAYVKEAADDVGKKMSDISFSLDIGKPSTEITNPPKSNEPALTAVVKTGDDSNAIVYTVVLVVAAVILVIFTLVMISRRNDKNHLSE